MQQTILHSMVNALVDAVERAGFSAYGPTDLRVCMHGEPAWVCRARALIAQGQLASDTVVEVLQAIASGNPDPENMVSMAQDAYTDMVRRATMI